MVAASELPIDHRASATEMAETIFGEGVTVVDATYTGNNNASGIYTDGNATSPGVVPSDEGVILSTGRVRDFTNSSGDANQSGSTSTDNNRGVDNDPDLNALAGTTTYDGAILDVDFIPEGDTLTMQFVFASEEYPEYVDSIFNDVVAIWVNGELAEVTVAQDTVSIDNINELATENLYVDNTGSDFNTEMDGFTVTLTVTATVTPDEVNSIRIAIADAGDAQYDSNLLIAANSAQTALIANDDSLTVAPEGSRTIDVLANDEGGAGVTLTITHINGVAVTAGDSVVLASGETVTLNADGTLTVDADAGEESIAFSYTASDGTSSATAFVTADIVPCFVAGTLIDTPGGPVPVETLTPGDMVLTRDSGPQPLRWIGRRTVPARGDLAPIRIAAGTFGDHDTLMVSPQHRVLVRDGLAELLFGEPEVLVAAKHLVNDRTVLRRPGGLVSYVHLLFDRHEIVFSAGLPTESFQPGPQACAAFAEDAMAELCRIFPELDLATGAGYGAAARPTLKSYEAHLLVGAGRRAA